jgi:hypothetical protein
VDRKSFYIIIVLSASARGIVWRNKLGSHSHYRTDDRFLFTLQHRVAYTDKSKNRQWMTHMKMLVSNSLNEQRTTKKRVGVSVDSSEKNVHKEFRKLNTRVVCQKYNNCVE